jgi:tRNA threonylcarbamoyladenosine biosynthesis protein TsaE|tara:strand:- start:45 stop:500 length:456 start_codon:yes stop_codon:yes gene_type:complete
MIIKSLENLKSLSVTIAKKLSKSDCIFLIGEIGAGKTTFTRYLINYLQEKNNIKQTDILSPTFNLLYEYDIKNYKIMHYDLYRLKDSQEVMQLDIFNEISETVKIIEWPELIKNNIDNRIELKFYHTTIENERNLEIKGYGKWENLKINEL